MTDAPLKLGFACAWDRTPQTTWSGTPWNLRGALAAKAEVADVGPEVPALVKNAIRVASVRRRNGRWASGWRWSPAWERAAGASIWRSLRHEPVDALLQIGDFGVFDLPYFLYQDSNVDVLEDLVAQWPSGIPGLPPLDQSGLARRRRRQRHIYGQCEAVFAMSEWFKGVLTTRSGVPPDRVAVVRAGAHAAPGPQALPQPGIRTRSRLLFIGREFWRKGGDLVVEATRVLRDRGSDITLTVAGPREWPLPGAPPAGVRFEGAVSIERVTDLLSSHDLFVMPSRFEAFGIALVEALTHGLPCVARDAYAMTEIVTPGVNGSLIDNDDVGALCESILSVLESDEVYERTWADRESMVARYSWDHVAELMVGRISDAVRV